jgi:NADPH-dependent 2,4-dienoyl-CoA reductase/sulfur reductase-like enzyme
MHNHRYLIIGGGMAAAAAVRGLREVDAHGSIGLISEEGDLPYKRPWLSKTLWRGGSINRIWSGIDNLGVTSYLGRTAAAIDAGNKQVTDRQGTIYSFDKLLLATGGTPRRLPFGEDRILSFCTLDDYRHLRALAERRQRFAVIGGGFIATEIAAALRMNGKEVVMILPEDVIGKRLFPHELAQFVTTFYREQGVEVLTGEKVTGLETQGEQLTLTTTSGRAVLADGVVAGIGIQPNIGLAQAAGLAVGNGIRVDACLRTSHPDIYAAGDVAEFLDHTLGGHRRVEHEDNANAMGRLAGRAMAGEPEPYHHLPFFYSDLFDLGYEAVGELDSRLETMADWTEPYRTGVVYYLTAGRVRGVLLWNVWGQVDAARQLLAEPGQYERADLIGWLPRSTTEPSPAGENDSSRGEQQ